MKTYSYRRISTILIPAILAAILVWFAFRGVNWGAMLATLRHAHPSLVALAFGVILVAYILRTLRWRVLLSAERLLPVRDVFATLVLGYVGNNFLPARAGEVLRSYLLARRDSLSLSFVLATALTERITDAGALVLISLAVIPFLPSLPAWLLASSRVMAVVVAAGLITLILAPRFPHAPQAILGRLPFPRRVQITIEALWEQCLLGLRAFQHPTRGAAFFGLTLLIWGTDGTTAFTLAHALGLALSYPEALLLLAALGLASAIPSTPGYVGIYQFVAVTVLIPFGLSRSVALAFILAFQAVQYAELLALALPSALYLHAWPLRGPRPAVRPAEVADERA